MTDAGRGCNMTMCASVAGQSFMPSVSSQTQLHACKGALRLVRWTETREGNSIRGPLSL